MEDPTPLLFPIEPEVADPARIELSEELVESAAALLAQVFDAREEGEVTDED